MALSSENTATAAIVALAPLVLFSVSAFGASPEGTGSVTDVVGALSSPDYSERRHAVEKAESAVISEGAALSTSEDAETNSEIAKILQFSQRLDSLLLEAEKWPATKRAVVFQFLQTPAALTVRAQLFSPSAEERIAGVHALAGLQGPAVDSLLGYFLNDESLEVRMATLDGVWDRPASEPVVAGVWYLAIGRELAAKKNAVGPMTGVALAGPAHAAGGQVRLFRGQPLAGGGMGTVLMAVSPFGGVPALDTQAAVRVLGHIRGPLVETRLNGLLQALNDQCQNTNVDASGTSIGALRSVMQGVCAIGEACQFKSSIPYFYALATMPLTPAREMGGGGNNPMAMPYTSVRTSVLLATIGFTGQDPAAYGATKGNGMFGIGVHFESKDDEQKAADQLTAWWKEHGSSLTAAK